MSGLGGYRHPNHSHGAQRHIAVSPHLDDAVFSAGGTLALLADAGHEVLVVTCFTATVADPSPFALSTQLDKGLGADVDYMALRRAEDDDALAVLGVTGHHLPLPEAPHRGYTSAPDLFGGRHDDDTVAAALAETLRPLLEGADLVLAPQAVGDHVDHRIVTAVVADLAPADRVAWWRDAPYALRNTQSPPAPEIPAGHDCVMDVGSVLDRKVAAACCYRTQIGFQFGGPDRVGEDLRALGEDEALRAGREGVAEVLRVGDRAVRFLRV